MDLSIFVSFFTGLLYATAYFQFVNLLRYLRNWTPMPKIAICKCCILIIFVVTVSSLSSGEFNVLVLMVTLAFISLMFLIIASPALAFSPTSTIVEFIAKHSDYAGLWLGPIAFIAGVTIPNEGLHGILAIAILIEFSWFLRRRRQDQNRETRPLSEAAVLVMNRQADGHIDKFAKKHRIVELEFGETLGWHGCTKTSAPCPFNLYVNKLGLNTAPCCSEHLIELCHYAISCLNDVGITHWLEGGTLLGAVREGKQLAWEDDVDISVLLDNEITWEYLVSILKQRTAVDGFAFEAFPECEVISLCFDRREVWPFGYERNRLRGDLRVDISAYRQGTNAGNSVLERFTSKAKMPVMENGKYGVPTEIILPTSKILLSNASVPCPQNSDAYLRLLYGDYTEIAYTYIEAHAAAKRSNKISLER